MSVEILVPQLGESVVEATVGEWFKKEGDSVSLGDILVSLETDKVDLEIGAKESGVLGKILQPEGSDVEVGAVLALLEPTGSATKSPPSKTAPAKPAVTPPAAKASKDKITPVARRMAEAEGVDIDNLTAQTATGKITREDVASYLAQQTKTAAIPSTSPTIELPSMLNNQRQEERIKMSRRRRTIAQRLVQAQQTAAMLTTFNEVDMGAVMDLRRRHKSSFQTKYGMSVPMSAFFIKAAVSALKAFPRLNAEIQEDEMVLKHYYDVGMAIGAEEGLVVPVLRDTDRMSFAEIGQSISDYAQKAKNGTLALEDLRGGSFTITNGGVFGSMLSTPILNPPQVAILGLHNIVDRPSVFNGEIAIRPIMYMALTYDHRIVDGREAVQFLMHIKNLIEDPEQLLLLG